ncbi:arginine decarboxylase [Dongia mobilis]|uniref:Arginine decarboxylase n=2 Tax=Dongia mobilis TaxID=578943 RepID=A0A4R6WSP4_9PROT|nr:lysine decarboxylase [Dongia mobilis]TDQ82074.1 arginine decarboxylase [Dongia mobilis]
MVQHLNFPILIVHREVGQPSAAGRRLAEIARHLEADGFATITTGDYADAAIVAATHRGLSALLFGEAALAGDKSAQARMQEIVAGIRQRAPGLPMIALAETHAAPVTPPAARSRGAGRKAPARRQEGTRGLLGEVRQVIYLYEDTVAFVARQIERVAENYLQGLLPPFFQALVEHASRSNFSWHTPGHAGGVALKKSPVGRAFHDFFGENTLRADLSISVPQLGSLLDHIGPVKEAEARAARNFGADHCFFVTNGTSTANKIVWQGFVGKDDIVLVDRNCHKSILHAIIMTGATPVYLEPKRNALGIIGPIGREQFSPEAIQKRIAANPLTRGLGQARGRGKARVRLASITNSTYDGLCYNAEAIKETINGAVDVLHFDEAWYGYAAFHEFYAGRHGMGRRHGFPRAGHPIVVATQSTHKLLAAFSQASMIHVEDAEKPRFDWARFNEAFMMHTSTSPAYGIIASCDVASAMMEGPAGRSLVEETHEEARGFRAAMADVRRGLGARDWWFSVWQPDGIDLDRPTSNADWTLKPGAAWHGYGAVAKDFVTLDPIKVTIRTPGLEIDGRMPAFGVPAAVVSKFLGERGIVVEKTGLYSFLVLFSMGITKGKWNTLVTELLAFKRAFDENQPLERALPSIMAKHGDAYQGLGLKDLCQRLHDCYRGDKIPARMNAMFSGLPEPVMKPAEAYDRLVHGKYETVAIDNLAGRVAAVMLVPYPPGIPLIMPGERYGEGAEPILDYLKFARDFDRRFPGFEIDIHGIRFETGKNGENLYLVDCLRE